MKPLIVNIKEFLEFNMVTFINYLTKYIESYDLPLGQSQINAWEDCYNFLQEQLIKVENKYNDLSMVFEYMLPLEKYRRPDVMLLFNEKVVILEFKEKAMVEVKDVEQAVGYREDIKHFHYITEKLGMNVECSLVATKSEDIEVTHRGIKVLNSTNFLKKIFSEDITSLSKDNVDKWVNSKYEPIPSIIEATQKLFFDGELPYIKSIADGDIESTVNRVKDLIYENENINKGKRIIFVSGVPGSGKTLVALKTLYDYNKDKYENENIPFGAVYLSGNGPLVSVLKEQLSTGTVNGLEGKAYIKGMLEYKKEYLNNNNVPTSTVLLFDEAQRAWDKKQMKKNYSEPEGLFQIGEKIYKEKGHVTIICFVGDGQSIYKGEEQGLKLWEEALKVNKDWEVYLPEKYKDEFSFLGNEIVDEDLFLDTSIRSNFIDTSPWIEYLLRLDTIECKKQLEYIQNKGLVIRIARDIESVIRFSKNFTKEKFNSNYGFLISSKCKSAKLKITKYTKGYFKGSYITDKDAGKWFIEDCKQLNEAASEFLCQGLEIDLPIVIFGGDYYIKDNKWHITQKIKEKHKGIYEDYDKIIENTYRVLLSRARKGMILFIPNSSGFDETYRYLRELGIEEI